MRKSQILLAAATVGVIIIGVSRQSYATSYASGLTVSGSTVNFDLNESVDGSIPNSATGDVKIFYNGTSQDLGALPAGPQSVTLAAAPTTPVHVVVTTNDGSGFLSANSTLASDGLTPESTALEIDPPFVANGNHDGVIFGAPRGVAVVNDPTNPAFGRIYVGNASTNTVVSNPQVGIYALNPDFTWVGQYATQADAAAANAPMTELAGPAGITFGGGSSDPWRMAIGPDGYLYISSWHDATGGMLRAQVTPAGLADGSNVFSQSGVASPNHSDILSAAVVHGSTATGDLTVTAIDPYFGGASYGTGTDANQIFKWTIGGSTGYSGAPTKILDVESGYQIPDTSGDGNGLPYMPLDSRFWSPQNLYVASGASAASAHWYNDFGGVDFDLAQGGPDNQFYVAQSRSAGTNPDLFVLASDNSQVVWDSLDATFRQGLLNADWILGAYSEAVSPDGRFILIGQSGGAAVDYGAYIMPLLAGMPDLRLSMPFTAEASGYTYRQPAFDAAGNAYATATYGSTSIGAYGPGGSTVSVTGSDGTFTTTGQWTADANGNLSDTSKWLVGNIPNGKDQVLTFGATTTAQRTVSVDTGVTAGAIVFSSPNGYVLSNGGGSITLDGMGANLTAKAGNNEIKSAVTVNTDLGLYAASGASLTVSGPITYGNVTAWSSSATPDVVKNGAGTVSVSNLNLVQSNIGDKTSGNLDIYEGKLVLLKDSGPAVVSELSVFTQQGATLDLTNNDLIVDYNIDAYTTTSPFAVIQSLVASGYDHGAWDGPGIVTSADQKGATLAVVENGMLPNPFNTFDQQSVSSVVGANNGDMGTVLVKFTWYGDLNLDGVVDSKDKAMMNSGDVSEGWIDGDLNYDGVINQDDWSLFQLGAAMSGGHNINVPEPASMAMLGLIAAAPMIRRRRKA